MLHPTWKTYASCRAATLILALAGGCDNTTRPSARADEPSATGPQTMTTTTSPSHDAEASEHKHTNRLIHATSPYLLQHAHNPVNWYPWGPEALQKARTDDKPIFLSIGYSACHWCHVMERESFENEDIAAIMNQHFVCIKVDREERPDLDAIYMAATQAFTRSGGWPMSVWLTPDLKPFYAGTYFPPDRRYGRPGFKDLLLYLAKTWNEDRDKALTQADAITDAVRRLTTVEPGDSDVPLDVVTSTARKLAGAFDSVKGGMSGGGNNKFPPSMAMDLMLRAYHQSLTDADGPARPDTRLLELVELTLDKMAQGGIYDHLGGGFARYSTDPDWLVPHFEKMLYDQALISDIYLDAYQLTGKPLYARIAREVFDYVIADLQDPTGGFYSTRDADSEGKEGKFYVWTRSEVVDILGDADARLFSAYYDVTEDGNWEGHNILNTPRPLETVAKLHKISADDLEQRLSAARKKMFLAREQRIKPHLDDKILAAWNGLMIASLARGACILRDPAYQRAATRAADFVMTKMVKDGRLLRTYRRGTAHTPAYLDDHAFMIEALVNLYEATADLKWLDHAVDLNRTVLSRFRDERDGGFFFTADDAETLLVRAKDADDGAIPSGNSVQLMNLLRLAVLLDRKDLAQEAERLIRTFSTQLRDNPFRSERLLAAVDFHIRRPREIALVSTGRDAPAFDALLAAAWGIYVPNAVLARIDVGTPQAGRITQTIPLLAGKTPLNGRPAAYVCRNYVCEAPTDDPAVLRKQLTR